MVKPRLKLKRQQCLGVSLVTWSCVGGGVEELASTPKLAYEHWCIRLLKRKDC